jgi:hypothetical protein
MSLEVAEHLEPSAAPQFIKSVTASADVVLFSAAYTKQGGTNHINEQPHTYWAQLFAEQGFMPFDLFRPVFWGNEQVCFWYRQNVFLYIKKDSDPWRRIVACGFKEIADLSFMNCVHPDLYNIKTAEPPQPTLKSYAELPPPTVKSHKSDLVSNLPRAIIRRWFPSGSG